MATRDEASFRRMCRTFPIRTGVFTVGPLAFALAQVLNAAVHGVPVWPVALVAAVMCVFSALVTDYHLARFRRRRLEPLGD